MDPDTSTDEDRGDSGTNDIDTGNTIAVDSENLRTTSEVSLASDISSTSVSSMSETSSVQELDKTVVEAVPRDAGETPDYKQMYERYKQLLDEKTADIQSQMDTLKSSNDKGKEEYGKLLVSYRTLEAAKKAADQEVAEKDKMIREQNAQLSSGGSATDIRTMCLKRGVNECIKMKVKRRTGSTKNVDVNTCEFPGCGEVDTDLVMCSSCGRYVCETCNNVPVSKLKTVVKVCDSIHFICRECSSPETSAVTGVSVKVNNNTERSLQEEVNDKIKIIESMETRQDTLNNLVKDRNEVIESQKTITDNLKIELSLTGDDLSESRKIIKLKEEEMLNLKSELSNLKSELSAVKESRCGEQKTDRMMAEKILIFSAIMPSSNK